MSATGYTSRVMEYEVRFVIGCVNIMVLAYVEDIYDYDDDAGREDAAVRQAIDNASDSDVSIYGYDEVEVRHTANL